MGTTKPTGTPAAPETPGDKVNGDLPPTADQADTPPATPSVEDLEAMAERVKARRQAVQDKVLSADVVTFDPVTSEPVIIVKGTKVGDLDDAWADWFDGRDHLFAPDPLAPGQYETGEKNGFRLVGGSGR